MPRSIQQIGPYQVQRLLGSGAIADVYLAADENLGCQVAIKLLRRTLPIAGPDDELSHAHSSRSGHLQRFLREWRALGKLNHPNIVRARYAGQDKGRPYLVMDYVEAIDLDTWAVQHGPARLDQACEWMIQLCDGLACAHENGIIHRDLKPSNLLRCGDQTVKIVDFGISLYCVDGETDARMTLPGMLMGTPDFMSPEQIEDVSAADARSDIYSLGCTLYFLLFGYAPFDHHRTLAGKLDAHRNEPAVVALKSIDGSKGQRRLVKSLLERMLAKQPDQRPQRVCEVREELARIVQHQQARARWTSRSANRRWLVACLAIAACAALLAGGIVWSMRPAYDGAVTRPTETGQFAARSRTRQDPKAGSPATSATAQSRSEVLRDEHRKPRESVGGEVASLEPPPGSGGGRDALVGEDVSSSNGQSAAEERSAVSGQAASADQLLPSPRDDASSESHESSPQRTAVVVPEPFSVSLSLPAQSHVITEAEPVELVVQANRECSIFVFRRGVQGTVELLFPNPLDSDNEIRSGEPRVLPGQDAAWEFFVSPPFGEEQFVALVIDRRAATDRWTYRTVAELQGSRDRDGQPATTAAVIERMTSELAPGMWATAQLEITTRSAGSVGEPKRL